MREKWVIPATAALALGAIWAPRFVFVAVLGSKRSAWIADPYLYVSASHLRTNWILVLLGAGSFVLAVGFWRATTVEATKRALLFRVAIGLWIGGSAATLTRTLMFPAAPRLVLEIGSSKNVVDPASVVLAIGLLFVIPLMFRPAFLLEDPDHGFEWRRFFGRSAAG